jgi:hypothetical protein
MRVVHTIHGYNGTESYGSRRLNALGLPPFDLFVARNEERERAFVINGDAVDVLGRLADAEVVAQ